MNRLISLLLSLFIALPAQAAGPVIWGPGGAQNISSGPVYDNNVPYIKQPQTNYIANQSGLINTTGWGVSGAVTVTRVTSSLPRATTVGTGLSLAAGSADDYAQYCWTIDDADLNTKMQWSWSQAPGSYADGDFDAQVYSFTSASCGGSATELSLSTDNSSGDTEIPNYDGTYYTTFDTTDALYYGIRYVRKAGTSTLVISNVIVGPGNIVAVPAVGVTESWTPTGSWSSNATYTGVKKRDNDRGYYEVRIALAGAPTSATLTVNMPSGETIDTSKILDTTRGRLGYATVYDATGTGSGRLLGEVFYNNSTSVRVVASDPSAAPWTISVTQVAPVTFASGDQIYLEWDVPIAEWAGAPNYAGQNDVEYVYNSSTTTSNDTSSFAYGPQGIAVASFAPAGTTAVAKDVQFLTPLQSDEVFSLQFNDGFGWTDVGNTELGFSSNDAGTTFYGAKATATSSTKVRVSFYSKANELTAWSSYTSYKWRVVKAKAGAAVGFGLADTSGRAGLVNPYTEGSGVVYSGTYTPTVSNLTNGSAATVRQHNYMRVGKIVFVSGRVDFTLTTTLTDTTFDLTLPVSTANFGDGYQATGSGMLHRSASAVSNPALVYSVNSSQTVQVFIEYATAPSATSVQAYYSFSYEIQ